MAVFASCDTAIFTCNSGTITNEHIKKRMTNKAIIRKPLCLKIKAGISSILRFAVTVIAILWMPVAVYAWDENKSYIEQSDIDASEFMIRIQTGNILSFIIGVAILALLIGYSKKYLSIGKRFFPCPAFILFWQAFSGLLHDPDTQI